jgi:hypothetical protein
MLNARDVVFTEELRKAVPWRVRRLWNDLKPSGRCDLDLRDIVVSRGPGDNSSWKGKGTIALKQAGFTAGTALTDVVGTLNGEAACEGQFQFDVNLKLQQARVDGRLLTDATARMVRPADSAVLRIENILSKFYSGDLLGEVEVDYAKRLPTYGVTLTARGVSLQDFLNAKRRPDEPELKLKGRIEGTLALTGQIGNPASRQGSGSVLISDAQIIKMPMILSILQLINFTADSNAFHDALLDFMVDGDDVILERIDLRGKSLSMVGAGRVQATSTAMHLILLVGSPLRLPRVQVLSELLEGVARELIEVHVQGTLEQPTFRADIVRSLRKSIEAMTAVRVERGSPKRRGGKE